MKIRYERSGKAFARTISNASAGYAVYMPIPVSSN